MAIVSNIPFKQFITPKKIITAGLLVGVIDGVAAIINYLIKGGKHPEKVFTFIASGFFGKEGLTGGTSMVICGVVFHLLIACIWTAIFFFAYSKIRIMRKNWIITGSIYGIIVWAVMTRLVMPLSNTPLIPFKINQAIIAAMILIIAIGLPLSFIATKQYRKNT